jgi:hypothetical protein
VRYEVNERVEDQEILEDWCAWDVTAMEPNIGFDLWIWSSDLPKVGSKIVEIFPERKFGAQ